MIDSQELFGYLQDIAPEHDALKYVLYTQNQNVRHSLIDIDEHCFESMRKFYLLLCSVQSEEGNLSSALFSDYKELQNLLKKDMYIINPNDDICLKTNLIKVMDTAQKAESLIKETIHLIDHAYLHKETSQNMQRLQDPSFV